MSARKGIDSTVLIAAVVGSLVVVNLLGLDWFGRIDLTSDNQFTLSSATKKLLRSLEDPVTIRAYFTKNMPPPYGSNARYVKDLLDEYYSNAHGKLNYEFKDPVAEETEEDKEKKKEVKKDIFGRQFREQTDMEEELQAAGIPPLQIQVNEDDKLEVKRVYMGILIKHGDKTEVIPAVKETGGLEYDLTTLIRKVTQAKAPKVAFVTGHENPDLQKDLGKAHGSLTQLYDVTTVDLSSTDKIPDDVDAILVVGPKTRYKEEQLRAIDNFLMAGKAGAFLLDSVFPDLQTLEVTDADHGVDELLASYGVRIEKGLVLDAACEMINISQQRGFMRIMQPVKYPFIPIVNALSSEHPLTRGMSKVPFPFMSPLTVESKEGVESNVLVASSDKSWVQSPPYNLDPLQRWTLDGIGDKGVKHLIATLSGKLPSHFGGAWAPPGQADDRPAARVLVAAGSSFMRDQFLSPQAQAFVLNMVDWLVLDDDLLSIRSRGLAAAPLQEDLSEGTRNTLKYFNIAGVPLLFVGVGLVRWRLRESRRAKAQF